MEPHGVDTAIVPIPVKLLLAGIPLTPVPRIAGAILYAATDPDPETNGSAWLLTDDGPVFMVPREEFKMGVYKMIDDRANAMIKCVICAAIIYPLTGFVDRGVTGIAYYARLVGDLGRILGKPLLIAGLGAGAAKISWDNRDLVLRYINSIL